MLKSHNPAIDIDSPLPLECTAQTYAWGKRGAESLVAKFLSSFQEETPYAWSV